MRPSYLFSAVILCAAAATAQQKPLPYLDPALPREQRAADLVSRLTLDEKVSQMVNGSAAIPRLGVPAYNWWNEGLHGVARSGYATTFPQAIGMAAMWDAPLMKQIGNVISDEARAKNTDALRHGNHGIYYGLTFWSPNINIFRDPRWGRGQETYGEDPFLTAQMGVNFVEGLQGDNPDFYKVIATPKHFAVHSGPESTRHVANIDPSPHDLWDTYLPAFRATIVDAKADSIMCAYNAIDSQPACGSNLLLKDILRNDWHFAGFVTSDCGAIDDFYEPHKHDVSPDKAHAAAAGLLAGTDTNCGKTYASLKEAVEQHLVTEADIDVSLRRLYLARMKLGLFDDPKTVPYTSIPLSTVNSPEHRAIALKAADESMVLLKNDGILPLAAAGRYKTIAVIGPNAASLAALEGNYNPMILDPQMPVDAIAKAFPDAHIVYAQGAPYADGIVMPVPRTMLHLTGEYFATPSFDGKPVVTRNDPQIDFDWNGASPTVGLPADAFAIRWSGTLQPQQPGTYNFAIRLYSDAEQVSVSIDGQAIAQPTKPARVHGFPITFTDTKPHALTIEYVHTAAKNNAGIRLEWTPQPGVLQTEALAAAKQADLIIAMPGLSRELEGEEMKVNAEGFAGGDRTDIKLPASQQQLLEALATTGKPLVVVLLNGSALAVNWANEHANAILEAWYPGEAGAAAIAATLNGQNNPAGRLPVTFYSDVAQLPAFDDYSMKNRTYRYFTGTPLYGFGYGLSFTHFAYSHLKLSASKLHAGDTLTAEADITNSGKRAGDEVAELYLIPPHEANGGLSPNRALEGFERLHLEPGQTRHVTFQLAPRQLSQVDAQGNRVVMPGAYRLALGGAQPNDPRASTPGVAAGFAIEGTQPLPH